jgi:hypothetical protein
MTKARDLADNALGSRPNELVTTIDAAGDLIYGTGSDAAASFGNWHSRTKC